MPGDPRARSLAPLWISALVLGLTLAAGPAAAALAEDRATAALDACIEALFSQEAAPRLGRRVDLAKFCPDLAPTLRAVASDAPRFEWAAKALSEHPSAAELLDLQTLLTAPPAPGTGLRWTRTPDQLSALLGEVLLADDSDDRLGWWDRLLEWLRDLVKARGDTDLSWLEEILDSIQFSEETANRILYGILALMILSLLALLVHELRAAGFLQGRRGAKIAKGARAAPGPATEATLTLSEIPHLDRGRQPTAILRLCIGELIARGRLPDDYSRTNRELHRSLEPGQTAASFGDLVQLAEAISYGGHPVTDQVLARCYSGAEHILGAR